jgi:hypothetical protein
LDIFEKELEPVKRIISRAITLGKDATYYSFISFDALPTRLWVNVLT